MQGKALIREVLGLVLKVAVWGLAGLNDLYCKSSVL